jgi:hypothetical protein
MPTSKLRRIPVFAIVRSSRFLARQLSGERMGAGSIKSRVFTWSGAETERCQNTRVAVNDLTCGLGLR